MKMRVMKVFDCQEMPNDLRKEFFDIWKGNFKGNDCFIEQDVGEMDRGPIRAWLIANGAGEEENVLVSHWW